MIPANVVRSGGLAAVLAGVLLVIGEILHSTIDFKNFSQAALTGTYTLGALLFLLSNVLLLVGLVGLYARQSEAAGLLGMVGFLVALVGTGLAIGVSWEEVFVPPALAQLIQSDPAVADPALLDAGPPAWVNFGFVLSFALFALGWLLFGVATLRARVYPRAAAIVLIVGAVLAFFPLPFSTVVFAAAVSWMGFALLTGRGVTAEQSARVS